MARFRTLLVQIDPDIWQAADDTAKLAGITKKQLVEAMLAAAADRPHKHIHTQRAAWARYRKSRRTTT